MMNLTHLVVSDAVEACNGFVVELECVRSHESSGHCVGKWFVYGFRPLERLRVGGTVECCYEAICPF